MLELLCTACGCWRPLVVALVCVEPLGEQSLFAGVLRGEPRPSRSGQEQDGDDLVDVGVVISSWMTLLIHRGRGAPSSPPLSGPLSVSSVGSPVRMCVRMCVLRQTARHLWIRCGAIEC
jgi:hypothetical protein